MKLLKSSAFLLLALSSSTEVVTATSADECQNLVMKFRKDAALLEHLQKLDKEGHENEKKNLGEYFEDCLDSMVRSNMFSSVKFLIETQFADGSKFDKDSGKQLSRAQSVVQSAIQYVKSQQDQIMQVFESA